MAKKITKTKIEDSNQEIENGVTFKPKGKKLCNKCGEEKSYSNYSKHFKACQGKSKNDIAEERQQLLAKIMDLEKRIKLLEEENIILKNNIETIDEPINVENYVEMKAENTKTSYLKHWGDYRDWCVINKKKISAKKSVLDYYNYICKDQIKKKKYTTLNLIRAVLVSIFKSLFDINIRKSLTINKSDNVQKKKKYCMSDEEIANYLNEFKHNPQNYLSQYLLIVSGCRVNSLANAKIKDFTNEQVLLYDSKIDKRVDYKIDNQLILKMFKDFCEGKDPEEFMFFPPIIAIKFKNERELYKKRSKYVAQFIRILIRNSFTLKNVDRDKYCLSPHMFRTTKAMLNFWEIVNAGLEKARESIHHSKNSNAINFYVTDIDKKNIYKNLVGDFKTDQKTAENVEIKTEEKSNVNEMEVDS